MRWPPPLWTRVGRVVAPTFSSDSSSRAVVIPINPHAAGLGVFVIGHLTCVCPLGPSDFRLCFGWQAWLRMRRMEGQRPRSGITPLDFASGVVILS